MYDSNMIGRVFPLKCIETSHVSQTLRNQRVEKIDENFSFRIFPPQKIFTELNRLVPKLLIIRNVSRVPLWFHLIHNKVILLGPLLLEWRKIICKRSWCSPKWWTEGAWQLIETIKIMCLAILKIFFFFFYFFKLFLSFL